LQFDLVKPARDDVYFRAGLRLLLASHAMISQNRAFEALKQCAAVDDAITLWFLLGFCSHVAEGCLLLEKMDKDDRILTAERREEAFENAGEERSVQLRKTWGDLVKSPRLPEMKTVFWLRDKWYSHWDKGDKVFKRILKNAHADWGNAGIETNGDGAPMSAQFPFIERLLEPSIIDRFGLKNCVRDEALKRVVEMVAEMNARVLNVTWTLGIYLLEDHLNPSGPSDDF
jgi:hypothetical protein